jgi:hypothetical protein
MTETITTTEPEAASDPSDLLLTLILAFLSPMFLGVSGGDIALARSAAVATLQDYRARNHVELIAIAQIVGFGLAALGSLSLSFADDISVSMVLRLRGNAIACGRSAEQKRRALAKSQASDTPPPSYPAAEEDRPDDPDVFLTQAAEEFLAAESRARLEPSKAATRAPEPDRDQQVWADAMVRVAADITASIPNLPPGERKGAEIQAAALNATANDLYNAGAS